MKQTRNKKTLTKCWENTNQHHRLIYGKMLGITKLGLGICRSSTHFPPLPIIVNIQSMTSSTSSTLKKEPPVKEQFSRPGSNPRFSVVTAEPRDMDMFSRILSRFPSGRCLTFAYGSGVFKQTGHKSTKDNMTDFIITVDNPEVWHQQNRIKNPKDYATLLRLFGPQVMASIQDKWGARLFFNTLIPFEDGLIKYGVISKDAMLSDLLDWESLYAAGRLHKPVLILEKNVNSHEIHSALRLNLQSALHTALLLLPETFTEEEFYITLAGLSYTGDFRMIVGEDKNKVANIVKPNIPRFRELYSKRVQSLSNHVELNPSRGRGEQDSSSSGRHHHLTQLPKNLQWFLVKEWNKDGRYRDVEDVLRAAAVDRDSDDMIRKALKDIVGKTSISQALKGILTAGVGKTVKYSGAKLKKMAKSMN